MARLCRKLLDKHERLGRRSRARRAESSRWEDQMEVGTLMAAVWGTHWVDNALGFQGGRARCSGTRGIVFCLVSLPQESELQRSSRGCAKVAWGNEGGSDAMLLPGCELPPVPGLGCSYHYQRLMPRRTDSAGSTVLEGSQRRVGAHVIFQQGASEPYTPPHLPHWVPR